MSLFPVFNTILNISYSYYLRFSLVYVASYVRSHICSYVGSPGHPKSYIVTQSPTVDTVGDLWRLVWEQRVGVVVVLTCDGEVGEWWPEEGEARSHALVVGREWVNGECLYTLGPQIF